MSGDSNITAAQNERLLVILRQAAVSLESEFRVSGSECPESAAMVDYAAGRLDQETSRELNRHIAFCTSCSDDFLALLGPDRVTRMLESERSLVSSKEEGTQVKRWKRWRERAAQAVLDLGKVYDPGTLIGQLRILGAGPALAMRGSSPTAARTTSVEVTVGENVYGIVFSVGDARTVVEVAGYKTPLQAPVEIVLYSCEGNALLSRQSDEFGNAQLALAEVPADPVVVVLILGEDAWEAFSYQHGVAGESSA